MKDEQYNKLVELIGEANNKTDEKYNKLVELIEGTNEELKKTNKELEKTNQRLDRHIEEMNTSIKRMEDVVVGQSQLSQMRITTLEKADKYLEDFMLEIKQSSEQRDQMLEEKIDRRLKVAAV